MKARLSLSVLGPVVALMTIPASVSAQAAYEIVSSFENRFPPEGDQPYARLVQASDGSFYGVTSAGATAGAGTVFKLDTAGRLTTVHRFSGHDGATPYGALIQASDGRLYGTTSSGGTFGHGTVFRIDVGGTLETLHSFSGGGGATPLAGLIEAVDGRFYGTTSRGGPRDVGTVFVIDTAGTLRTLHSFNVADGANPEWPLVQGPDGLLYGTTRSGSGAVFTIDGTGVFTILRELGPQRAASGLTLASDGAFYGTTSADDGPYGTVFRMEASGTLTLLHSFEGADGANPYGGLIQAADGYFYGTTFGSTAAPVATVFKMDAAGKVTTLHRLTNEEGAGLWSGVIQGADGSLYGTARFGGAGHGTVFKMDATGTVTRVHRFRRHISKGFHPNALVEAADGRLYGTTARGGGAGYGTLFSLGADGTRTLLRTFSHESGHPSDSGLTQARSGHLWGTTTSGDLSRPPTPIQQQFPWGAGFGTVFSIDPAGAFTTVQAFGSLWSRWENNRLTAPAAGIIQARDGSFYGTTDATGEAVGSGGLIFRLDENGAYLWLHALYGSPGLGPAGELVEGRDGRLYGTTSTGGAAGFGTVFAFDQEGEIGFLHDFDSSAGHSRKNGLMEARDGALYGTTTSGGTFDHGTVFRMDGSGMLTTLHSFSERDGAVPLTRLVQGDDGRIYGTTRTGGDFGAGTVFAINRPGTLSTLHHFSRVDGAYPNSTLVQARDGHLYGTAKEGGPGDGGVVFRLRLPPNRPPLAADDTYRLAANTTLTQAAPGVLGNDTEPDGDSLTAILVDAAAHGAVVLHADGGFGYTPDADFHGQDRFRYRADDGRGFSAVATVFITVDPPVKMPMLTLSTTALAFSPQPIRQTSAPQAVVLTNTGTRTLRIKDVAIVGSARRDFLHTNTCGKPIKPGRQCVVQVTFAPLKKGVRQALIVLSHSAATEPTLVSLTGTGIKERKR